MTLLPLSTSRNASSWCAYRVSPWSVAHPTNASKRESGSTSRGMRSVRFFTPRVCRLKRALLTSWVVERLRESTRATGSAHYLRQSRRGWEVGRAPADAARPEMTRRRVRRDSLTGCQGFGAPDCWAGGNGGWALQRGRRSWPVGRCRPLVGCGGWRSYLVSLARWVAADRARARARTSSGTAYTVRASALPATAVTGVPSRARSW